METLPFSDPALEAVIEGILERHERENPGSEGLERFQMRGQIGKSANQFEVQDALDSLVAQGKIICDNGQYPKYRKEVTP